MPDAKRPDPRRRTPASRPARGGDAGGRPRGATPIRREPRVVEPRPAPVDADDATPDEAAGVGVVDSIRTAIAEAAEQRSEQRFGSAARRAAILAAVVCILTLTIAGPVRTYFAQRTEMRQLAAAEAQLRTQIKNLEQQRGKLGDPVFIAAQARERLGFVMPGEIPYQVQLNQPVGGDAPADGPAITSAPSGQPWYTSLWHTIADAPHGISPTVGSVPPTGPAPVPGPVPTPGPGG